jgi:hypothetical protein
MEPKRLQERRGVEPDGAPFETETEMLIAIRAGDVVSVSISNVHML